MYGLTASARPTARSLYSRRVNAEFNWWLLIVGLVIGAGLIWLVLADSSRREVDITTRERAGEARWIGEELRRAGRTVSDEDVAEVLDLHGAYLAAPPPDTELENEPPLTDDDPATEHTHWTPNPDPWVSVPPSSGGATLPQRHPAGGPGGSTRSDGDGLPV